MSEKIIIIARRMLCSWCRSNVNLLHTSIVLRFDVDEVMAMGEERRSSDISRLTLRLFGLLQALKPSLSTQHSPKK